MDIVESPTGIVCCGCPQRLLCKQLCLTGRHTMWRRVFATTRIRTTVRDADTISWMFAISASRMVILVVTVASCRSLFRHRLSRVVHREFSTNNNHS
eukprot:2580310-Amphidinium_carterae.1